HGDDAELEQAAREFGGHCLALTLLGSFLRDACGGDVRRRDLVGPLVNEEWHGWHARRVMTSYEDWLGNGSELAVLQLLGLFDRPRQRRPDAWRAGTDRLSAHYRQAAGERLATVAEMAPLYAAVAHGCAAGRHAEALAVYRERISQGNEGVDGRPVDSPGANLA